METINETAITNQAPLPNQRACGARTIHAVKGRLPKGYEVNSQIHTRLNAEKRKRQAATKRELLKQHRIPCLFVWDVELFQEDLSPVIRKIEGFIAQEGGRR
jgi:hypothetical protein